MYMEATGLEPGQKARLISPALDNFYTKKLCLSFSFVIFALHPGNLRVLNAVDEEMWAYLGCKYFTTFILEFIHVY